MLTPLDIHNKEFRRGFRGYSEEEVDEFLDEVVRDFEQLLRENATLKDQVEQITSRLRQYEGMERTLKETLIVAQETAEEVKAAARKEADLIVKEADMKGQRLIREAEERVRQYEARMAELRREMQAFRARMRSLYESQLELLRQEPDALELPASNREVAAESEAR